MSAHRTTIAHRLWLSLLVTFVLYFTSGVTSAWDESPMVGCEPEAKSVLLEPGDDNPDSGTLMQRNRPRLHGKRAVPARVTVQARAGTDRIALIRGPPAGYRQPA
jgi:hypothetical protein